MVASGLSNKKLSSTNQLDRRYQWRKSFGAYTTMVSLANQTGCPSNNEFLADSHDKSHNRREF